MAAPCSPAGKIPTTVLPVILRDDNVDITCYFLLRIWRHYNWTRNQSLVEALYPAIQNATRYLKSRDSFGDGVPAASPASYWLDKKK